MLFCYRAQPFVFFAVRFPFCYLIVVIMRLITTFWKRDGKKTINSFNNIDANDVSFFVVFTTKPHKKNLFVNKLRTAVSNTAMTMLSYTSFFFRFRILWRILESTLPKTSFSRHFLAWYVHGPVDCGILLFVNKDSFVGELISMLMVTVQWVSLYMRK